MSFETGMNLFVEMSLILVLLPMAVGVTAPAIRRRFLPIWYDGEAPRFKALTYLFELLFGNFVVIMFVASQPSGGELDLTRLVVVAMALWFGFDLVGHGLRLAVAFFGDTEGKIECRGCWFSRSFVDMVIPDCSATVDYCRKRNAEFPNGCLQGRPSIWTAF